MATKAPPRHRSAWKPAAAEAPVKRRRIAPGTASAGSLGQRQVAAGGFQAATELRRCVNDCRGRRPPRDWALQLGTRRVAREPAARCPIPSTPREESSQQLADLAPAGRALVSHRGPVSKSSREICAAPAHQSEPPSLEASPCIARLGAAVEALLRDHPGAAAAHADPPLGAGLQADHGGGAVRLGRRPDARSAEDAGQEADDAQPVAQSGDDCSALVRPSGPSMRAPRAPILATQIRHLILLGIYSCRYARPSLISRRSQRAPRSSVRGRRGQ